MGEENYGSDRLLITSHQGHVVTVYLITGDISLDDLGRTKSWITESLNSLNPVSVVSKGGEQHVCWQESCPQVC